MPIFVPLRAALKSIISSVMASPVSNSSSGGSSSYGGQSTTARVGGTDIDAALASGVQKENPANVAELATDMLSDYQVKETIGLLVANIRDTKVAITLDGETSELADAVTENLRESWENFLDQCFPLMNLEQSILAMGRSAFEKIVGNDPTTQTTRMKLRFLPPTVKGAVATKLRLTELGAFDGIDLEVGGKKIVIPAELALWTAIGATDIEPHGRSMFLGAAAAVRDKRKELEDLLTGYVKRCAINGPVIHAPATSQDTKGNVVDIFAAIGATMKNSWKFGNPVILSNASDEHGKYEIDVTQQAYELDPAPVTEITAMLDAQQSRALFVHEDLVSGGSEVGSYAKQKMIVKMMLAVVGGIVKSVMASFRKYYAEKEVALNWMANPPQVKMAVSSLSYSLIETLAESFLTAGTLSPLVVVADVEEILKSSGVPLVPDFKDKLEEAFASAAERRQAMADLAANGGNQQQSASGSNGSGNGADMNANDQQTGDKVTQRTLADTGQGVKKKPTLADWIASGSDASA